MEFVLFIYSQNTENLSFRIPKVNFRWLSEILSRRKLVTIWAWHACVDNNFVVLFSIRTATSEST